MRAPAYACGIIVDAQGRLLMERRYPRARHAPGRLTCYGGRRELRESARSCLYRELREELAWRPRRLGRAVDLWVGDGWIARFWVLRVPDLPSVPARGPGGWPVHLPAPAIGHPSVSRWHRAVLRAWRSGRRVARVES